MAIGLPVYNGERYLAASIESLLGQTYGDFTLLISDNASTDATQDICRAYAAKDGRIRYWRNQANLGAAANYNLTFHRSASEYFKWAAADDVHAPEYLEACITTLREAGPSVALAYCKTMMIDEHGEAIGPYEDRLDLRSPDPCARLAAFARRWDLGNPCFGLTRRATLARTGLIRPFVSSDIVLLAELALLGQVHELPERLFLRRVHPMSSRRAQVTLDEVAQWFDPADHRRHRLRGRTIVYGHTAKLIVTGDALPAWRRPLCLLRFSTAWAVRRTRVRLGRLRRRLGPRREPPRGPGVRP